MPYTNFSEQTQSLRNSRKLNTKLQDENEKYKRALGIALLYLKEWESWYEDMGKSQYYDFRDKIVEIEQVLNGSKEKSPKQQ